MRGFERTRAKRDLYLGVLASDQHLVQVLWGDRDPALKVDPYGSIAARAAGVELQRLPGKHFLQEDDAGDRRPDRDNHATCIAVSQRPTSSARLTRTAGSFHR